jgi:hypothetical protein
LERYLPSLKKVWLVLAQKKVLEENFYTTMVDAVLISPLLALPGKDNPGLGCHRHFFSVIFWVGQPLPSRNDCSRYE